jgi:ubiquinone/menaquinone biosynthesis C-methylase UbiE
MHAPASVDARLSQEKVKHVYDAYARFYDLWGAQTEGRARKHGIRLAQVQDGESILDVAVGTGLILADLARVNPAGFNAGIDISEGMLQKAREKLSGTPARVELRQGSAFEIPYPDAAFDLVINGYMFDLMPFEAMPGILAEFKRVLKSAGRVVLINMTVGERPGSQIYEWVYNLSPALMGGCRGVRLAGPLEQAGFQVLVREYQQQLLFPSEVILAKKA